MFQYLPARNNPRPRHMEKVSTWVAWSLYNGYKVILLYYSSDIFLVLVQIALESQYINVCN